MKNAWRKWHESALLAALLAACVVLALLQYRWTGELSRAEATRLSASAQGRLQQLARAFNTELRNEVLALVPSGQAVSQFGAVRANDEVLNRTASDPNRRPIFRRIAAAVRGREDALEFYEASRDAMAFAAKPWPEEAPWRALLQRLQEISKGGSPRGLILDPNSTLIEVPVFTDDREAEWMLFELDTDYVAAWVAQLVSAYMNPEGEAVFQVGVVWRSDPARPVWRDSPGAVLAPADAEASLFPLRFLGGRPGREEPGRWRILARHQLGSVPAAVTAAYRRNLMAGLLLLGLIVLAGIALLRNTREARKLAAAQYSFFAGISHELRTPLTVIQGAGHNLLSGVVKDEAQRESYLQAIVKQSSHLTEMVEQLLSYGAIRKQRPEGKAALDVAISEAIDTAGLELAQTGRSVDVDVPPALPQVRGDAVWLHRVFANLILNAIRHGAGEVRVTASRAGNVVETRIADSGSGIPPDELKQVFDPFFRGGQARTGRTRGTGLGLSLVKETVESLGGSVTAESELGKGTVFTVRLPVAE
jgi:signal transduction histidine kinase